MEESKSLLLIDKVEKPIITLKADASLDVEVDQLKNGIKFLKSLDIIIHPRNQEDEVVLGAGGEVGLKMDGWTDGWMDEGLHVCMNK